MRKQGKLIFGIFGFLILQVLFITILHGQGEGMLFLRSSPAGATVYIDGNRMTGNTPFQKQLKPGTYQYRLALGLYHSHTGSFTISPARTTTLDITLKPMFGSLHVKSEPDDARIYIDGELQKKVTPALFNRISSGLHTVRIEKEDYATATREVMIREQLLEAVFFELVPEFGSIGITSEPEAVILIDGLEVGMGTYFGRLKEGTHTIEARKVNHESEIRSINIISGEAMKLDFKLIPHTGSISVICSPPEVEIFLDDKSYGLSPMIIPGIRVGTYTLSLRKTGYRTIEREIELLRNEVLQVTDELIKGGVKFRLTSNPEQAELYLDGHSQGFTPLELIVPPGPHRMKLSAPYRMDLDTMLRITGDRSVHLNLRSATSPVTFLSTPPGAMVLIDSRRVGTTSLTIPVPHGPRQVKMTRKGFNSTETEIEFNSSQYQIDFLLYPVNYRKKGTAVLLSTLWPGGGQSYLNRGSWHLAFGAAGYGMLGGSFYFNREALLNYDLYLEETDPVAREELKNMWQDQQRNSGVLLAAAGTIWGVNLLWTLLMPDEYKRYQKIKAITTFDNISKSAQVGMRVTF